MKCPLGYRAKRAARLAFSGALLAGAVWLAACARSSKESARQLFRKASGAFEDGNNEAALALMERAAVLRPDQPRYLSALARLQVVNDRPLDAITTLGQLATMGVSLDVEHDDAFAGLQGYAAFDAVLRQLRANREPVGPGTVLFELPGMTGIIEGIAHRTKTGEYFFGDVSQRCVWVRRIDGSVQRFSPAHAGLLAVLGLAVDETRGSLWAATSGLPQMADYAPADRNRAALVEFSLADGSIRRVAPLPDDGNGHLLGDLTLTSDGTVYAGDSIAPVVWRLRPDAKQLEAWLKNDEFASLQGLVVTSDGKALLAADYANGLFHIDLATRAVRALTPPPDATLVGIDALAAAPDESAIGVQNGVEPRRIVRLWFDPMWRAVVKVEVLERAHPDMTDPTLGTLADDRFVFVGAAGWDRWEAQGPTDAAAPRAVPIMATRLLPSDHTP